MIGNRHYQLAQVVRASTAAPGFFRPEWLQVVPGAKPALFVDGGLSPYNNPSLQLLMLTQARAFGLRWPLGPERLLLVSVGTGQYRRGLHGAPQPTTAAGLALHSLMDAVADSQVLTLTLLQWFGQPALRWTINSEIGDLAGEVLGGHPLLAFARYNMPLESEWLERELGVRLGEPEMARLRRFDDPGNMNELHAMATRVAERQVQPEHIPTSFLEQPVG